MERHRTWNSPPPKQRGNVTLELALAMPVFLLLVAGVFDLGFLYWEKQVLTNAAREGARAASKAAANSGGTPEKTISQVRQVVQTYLDNFALKNLDGSHLVLDSSRFSYTWTTTPTGTVLTIRLNRIPCQLLLLPKAKALVGDSSPGGEVIYLSAETSMAAEWTAPPSP